MFYDNMGASAGGGILNGTNIVNLAMIDNLQSSVYWSGVPYAPSPSNAWAFGTRGGYQGHGNQRLEFYAWAVRAGDVTASSVPTPAPLWLIGSGLMALIGWKRKR